MAILCRIKELEYLEERYEWLQSINFCRTKWEANPNDLQAMMRFFSQQWLLSAYFYELPPFDEMAAKNKNQYIDAIKTFQSKKQFQAIAYLKQYGDEHFIKDPLYLCLSGYMMTQTYEYFGSIKFSEIQTEGEKRLSSAMLMSNKECALFSKAIKENYQIDKKVIDSMFPGKSAFDEYIKYELINIRKGR